MSLVARTTALAAVGGGLAWALVPALDDLAPTVLVGLPVIPALVFLGLVGLTLRYESTLGTLGGLAVGSLALGLALLFGASLWYAFVAGGTAVAGLVVAIPALVGVAFVAIGSILLAFRLWRTGVLEPWAALVLALALPADPLFNAIVTPILSVGLSVYGLTWVGLGVLLWRGIDESVAAVASEPARTE